MAAKFGTSGLRGLVEELSDGTAALHVTVFLEHMAAAGHILRGSEVCFGRDFRPSSPHIANQCMAAAAAAGFAPIDCGALPTPALALYAMARGQASVMITGSHIPADRNGVKFYRPDGEIDKADELAISSAVSLLPQTSQRLQTTANPANAADEARAEFATRYAGFLDADALAGKRIGIYRHSTVIRDMFADILGGFGAEIVPLGHSDEFIPVDTEAVSEETRASLRRWSREHRLDAIVSADGDADRPLLADETGECIRGDALGLIAALYLDADTLVTPVTSNSGIETAFKGNTVRTRVGSPYVIAGMIEQAEKAGSIIGFEANGGVLTASDFVSGSAELEALPTRDCVLPVLAALGASCRFKAPLSMIVSSLALPVAASGRIENFPTETSRKLVAELTTDSSARQRFLSPFGGEGSIDTTDGLRMRLGSGEILHLRPSGNAPEMRIYAEAETEEEAQNLIARAEQQIRDWVE